MSCNYHVIVGSMIEVKDQCYEIEEEFTACSKCNEEGEFKFCPSCGSKMIKKTKTVTEDIYLYEILEEAGLENKYTVNDNNFITHTSEKFTVEMYEYGFEEIPKPATLDDFKDLVNVLKEKEIEFNLKQGVLGYWS